MSWLDWFFPTTKPTPSSIIITDIQATTVKFCGFLPMAESVAALVVASNPTVAPTIASVDVIAKAICSVVSKPSPIIKTVSDGAVWQTNLPRTSFIVDGIPVQGRWVK